jgi:phage terminase Nu1 subunit (DNA packaging protein)
MNMEKLIDTKTAAPLLGITPATLENWRVRGEGPAFYKTPGRTGKVLYDVAEIAAWRARHRYTSTAQAEAADAKLRGE